MEAYDVVIRRGTIFDGSGSAPFTGDLAIRGDRIVALAPALSDARGSIEVDAAGMAVAPGFINMLSWATESLIEDGRSQGAIRSRGPPSASTWTTWSRAAGRATSPHLLARQPCESTRSGTRTARRRPMSSSGCANW